ncbi:MAG: GNAT family N-acetyltransferase [Bacteroidota bacterium]
MENSIQVEVNASPEDAGFIWNKIREFNKYTGPMLKYPPYEPYNIILKDQSNNIIAGITTRIYLKSMLVEVFWIDERYRRKGIGSELLNKVENYAKDQGCTFIHLDTFSFQAIDFYKKHGYSVFAVLEDYPDNVKRYYLKKYL